MKRRRRDQLPEIQSSVPSTTWALCGLYCPICLSGNISNFFHATFAAALRKKTIEEPSHELSIYLRRCLKSENRLAIECSSARLVKIQYSTTQRFRL